MPGPHTIRVPTLEELLEIDKHIVSLSTPLRLIPYEMESWKGETLTDWHKTLVETVQELVIEAKKSRGHIGPTTGELEALIRTVEENNKELIRRREERRIKKRSTTFMEELEKS